MAKRLESGYRIGPEAPDASASSSTIVLGADGRIVAPPVDAERAWFCARWAPAPRPSGVAAAESARLARRIRAVPNECWFNARRAVLRLDNYAGAGSVDDLAVTGQGLVVEHSWVVHGGLIVAPTLPGQVAASFAGLKPLDWAGIIDDVTQRWNHTQCC